MFKKNWNSIAGGSVFHVLPVFFFFFTYTLAISFSSKETKFITVIFGSQKQRTLTLVFINKALTHTDQLGEFSLNATSGTVLLLDLSEQSPYYESFLTVVYCSCHIWSLEHEEP